MTLKMEQEGADVFPLTTSGSVIALGALAEADGAPLRDLVEVRRRESMVRPGAEWVWEVHALTDPKQWDRAHGVLWDFLKSLAGRGSVNVDELGYYWHRDEPVAKAVTAAFAWKVSDGVTE